MNTPNLPVVFSPDEALEAARQLNSLRALLSTPQRQAMADMVREFADGPAKGYEDIPDEVHETGRAIAHTFRNIRALGPNIDELLQWVAKRRFEQAKIAASVERKNWYREYRERTNVMFAMNNALNDLRAMRAWQNPFLPNPVDLDNIQSAPVKMDDKGFWYRRG